MGYVGYKISIAKFRMFALGSSVLDVSLWFGRVGPFGVRFERSTALGDLAHFR